MQMQPVTAPVAVYIMMDNGDNDTTPDRLEDSETAMIPRHGNNESSSTVALRRATSTKSGHTKGPVVGVWRGGFWAWRRCDDPKMISVDGLL